jgi:hypothetical protein
MGLNNLVFNQQAEINAVVLYWPPWLRLEEDQFFDFCQVNNEIKQLLFWKIHHV